MQVGEGQQVQIVQAQPQGQAQQAQSGTGQTMQVMQQIITNTGEIQQIPVSSALPPALRGTMLCVTTGDIKDLIHTHTHTDYCVCVRLHTHTVF